MNDPENYEVKEGKRFLYEVVLPSGERKYTIKKEYDNFLLTVVLRVWEFYPDFDRCLICWNNPKEAERVTEEEFLKMVMKADNE